MHMIACTPGHIVLASLALCHGLIWAVLRLAPHAQLPHCSSSQRSWPIRFCGSHARARDELFSVVARLLNTHPNAAGGEPRFTACTVNSQDQPRLSRRSLPCRVAALLFCRGCES